MNAWNVMAGYDLELNSQPPVTLTLGFQLSPTHRALAHIPITLADVHGWIPDGTRNKDAFVEREPNDMELTNHQSRRCFRGCDPNTSRLLCYAVYK